MTNSREPFAKRVWMRLGWCPVCMRKAFLLAASFWIIAIAVRVGSSSEVSWRIAAGLAVLPTLLWLAHLTVYSLKATAMQFRTFSGSRRKSTATFLKFFLVATAGSAIPQLASAAQCGGTKDCSSKSCQNKKDSCIDGTNGCLCSH